MTNKTKHIIILHIFLKIISTLVQLKFFAERQMFSAALEAGIVVLGLRLTVIMFKLTAVGAWSTAVVFFEKECEIVAVVKSAF